MTRPPGTPWLPRTLVAFLLRGEMREVVLGDLEEEFARAIARGTSQAAARRLYWRQAIASIAAPLRRHGEDALSPRPGRLRTIRVPAVRGVVLDLRYAARVLAGAPGFTAVAVLSLAIGIGANATVYSVIRALLFESLPVERPDELALFYWRAPKSKVRVTQINSSNYRDPGSNEYYTSNYTYPMFAGMLEAAGPSADLVGFNFLRQLTISIDGRVPVVVGGLLASGNYFTTMRVGMAAGRPFGVQDDRREAPPVAVLSHAFWTEAFGGDPNIVGKVIRVNGAPCEVVGVTARGYRGLSQGGFYPATDVTLPLSSQPTVMPSWSTGPSAGASMFTSNLFWVRVLARVPTTFREIDRGVLDVLRREYLRLPGVEPAALDGLRVRRLPGARGLDAIRSDIERPLQFLAGVAAIVLVLACLNLSGLMLARGVARQRELSVRHALGAGRVRAVRLLMAESLLLSGIGGLLGVLVAIWTAPLVSSMVTTGLDAVSTPGVGWPLVATAGSVSALAAVLSGVIPALRLSGQQVSHLSQRSTTGGTRHAAGRMLIALQIAVSVPLLVGAGLLLRTIHNLTSAELGFDPQGLVIFRVEPGLDARGMDADPVAVYDRVLERVRRMPGVTSATLVENVLISGWSSSSDVRVGGNEVDMSMNAIGPDFFETMGIRIVAGRPISSADRAGAPAAVVINETAARTYFPGALPIGRRFTVGRQEVEIVGVASSTRYRSLRTAPLPSFYDSYAQRTLESFPRLAGILRSGTPRAMHVVLRASVPPRALVAAIPSAVSEVAPDLPVREIRTQADQIEQSIARERLLSRLLLIFGGFAVLLACIGLHGVTSYSVARRTSEIGIRVALGARRAQVIWLILRQVLVVALAGVALGVPIALLAGPVVASMLFGLAPRDAFTIVLAAAIMLSVALAAGWLPARRAARLPVVAALRLD